MVVHAGSSIRMGIAGLIVGVLASCSTSTPDGQEGGACYGNGTCNPGLECRSDVCVAGVEDRDAADSMPAGDLPVSQDQSTIHDTPLETAGDSNGSGDVSKPDDASLPGDTAQPGDAPGDGDGDGGGTVTPGLDLLAEPASLDFGSVALGGRKSITVTLRHVGSEGVVELGDISLEGLTGEFTFAPPAKDTLGVGESVDVIVTYAPLVAQPSDGELVILHNVAALDNRTRVPVTANPRAGELVAIPNPIDFESVNVGAEKQLDVILKNEGTDAILVNQVYLRLDGSTDFTVEAITLPDGKTLPFPLDPGDSLGLVLKYRPTGGGEDASTLVVEGDRDGQFAVWSFVVTGIETGPYLVASPGELDFRWVPLGTQSVLLLDVANEGNADLVIPAGGLTLWTGSDPQIVVKEAVGKDLAQDIVVAPGAFQGFRIGWTPTQVRADDGMPIGKLQIASNDLAQSPTVIPVFGRADAPMLVVIPDTVDMGFGAQATPVERQVTLRNEGHGALEVQGLEIRDPSDTQYGTEFEIVHGTDRSTTIGAFTVAGGGSDTARIVFTNKGPETGAITATLRILSNDSARPSVDVPLSVTRSGAAACNIALVPGGVNFGTVAIGWPVEKQISIVNIGTGPCTFKRAQIVDCPTGMFGGATCSAPFSGASSSVFQLTNQPPSIPGGLAAGATHAMTVRFDPPATNPMFGLLNQYSALLAVEVRDEARQVDIILPKGAGSPAVYQPNVTGASGIAKVSVLPGEARFGVTTIGCHGRTQKICIYNSGSAPLLVSDVRLVGCSPEFKVKNVPKLPLAVPNGAPKCIETVYAPQDEGPDTCTLQIDATDTSTPTVAVKLSGAGTYETGQVDLFTQVTGQEVDILWIIDDSGSMSEEQDRLGQSFSDFISQASVWGNDFHMGGISVNVTDEKVIGRLNRGDAAVTPRYMTKSNGGSFAKLTDYGSGGNSDSQEAGLQAAQAALSAPLATDTGIACDDDGDCSDDPAICPDPAKCAYQCIDGTCGGFNAGFLRDDAQLEMVVLSDEEDQSSGGLPFYIDFFKSIKGWYNVDMMHFNAIVGMEGGSAASCTAADGGTGEAGKRYFEVVQQTGGVADSICDSSYAPIMNQIGDITFRPKVQFFLSRLADPATVQVRVNADTCAAGWRYDTPSNSIIFDAEGACMPGQGDTIRVGYETYCLTS